MVDKVRADDSLDSWGGSGDGGKVVGFDYCLVKSVRPGLDTVVDRWERFKEDP